MKNLQTIKAQAIENVNEMERTEAFAEYRTIVRDIEDAMKTVVSCYNETRCGKTDDTVAAIVNALGYDNAMIAIAQLVNTVGDWDERVGSKARRWAASIEEAAERDEMREAGIFQPSAIHPAHIEQLAHAAERFEKPAQEAQEAQEAAQDPTEDEKPEAITKAAQEAHDEPREAVQLFAK